VPINEVDVGLHAYRPISYYDLTVNVSDFEKKISWLLAFGGSLTSLVVLSWNTTEPVNAPKLLVLGATGFGVLFFLIRNAKLILKSRTLSGIYVLASIFTFWSFISIFMSQSSITIGFFGVLGRNTGAITYTCLAMILVAATQIQSKLAVERVLNGLFYAGMVNAIYFTLTLIGIELIPWNNEYKRVLGTFGNPNFVGAFMGLFVILAVIRLLDSQRSIKSRSLTAITIPIALFEVKSSLASQGVVITVLGVIMVGFFGLWWRSQSRILVTTYLVLVTIAGIFAVGGALQIGPLSSIIYKSSVSFRGEYWAAGWNMGLANPIFGVGLDSYGDWYRQFRDESALISPGKNVTANAAHNVFIDIFASGGFPLLLTYTSLVLLVAFKVVHYIARGKKYDPTFVAVSTLWLGYQVQSIVSINQIGIAIWGWILSGLVIGYKPIENSEDQRIAIKSSSEKVNGRVIAKKSQRVSVVSMVLGGIIGTIVVAPPYLVDVKWRSVLSQPSFTSLEEGAKSWPLSLERIVQASQIYSRSNVPDKALELAKFGTEVFPNDFRAWVFYFYLPSITVDEKRRVKERLQALDPKNPDFK
jgi:O-antigen ligase